MSGYSQSRYAAIVQDMRLVSVRNLRSLERGPPGQR